jgi:hypothetical protein
LKLPLPSISAAAESNSRSNRLITIMSLVNLGLHLARPAIPQKYGKWIDVGHSVLDTLVDHQVLESSDPSSPNIVPTKDLASAILLSNDDPNHPLTLDDSVRNSLLGLSHS